MSNRVAFTVSQWQELEQQALIFKYLVAGISVPPHLLLPIRSSCDSRMLTGGWGPLLGNKVDPEPGRCRRTDGKKWRCSKDAYPDSKYCEWHMHRSRNRSRKPVETQTVSQPSTETSLPAAGICDESVPFHSMSSFQDPCACFNTSQMQVQRGLYGMSNKEWRHLPEVKDEIDDRSFFTEGSGSSRSSRMDSTFNNSWNLGPSRVNSFPPLKYRKESLLNSHYPLLQSMEDLGPTTIATALPKEEQHCFLGSNCKLGTGESMKTGQESADQPLRPFFDEWP